MLLWVRWAVGLVSAMVVDPDDGIAFARVDRRGFDAFRVEHCNWIFLVGTRLFVRD